MHSSPASALPYEFHGPRPAVHTRTTLDDDGQPVWIQRLDPVLAQDSIAREAFLHTARRLSEVSHPNVARVLQVIEPAQTEEPPQIVLEREGSAFLSKWLDEVELSVGEATEVAAQICLALLAVHERGLLHLSLGPDRVLLQRARGMAADVRVFGFGVAALPLPTERVSGERWTSSVTRYVAPEIAAGETPSPASDVYSVGALLYEMLCGPRALSARPRASVRHRWTPLIQHNPRLPETLVRAVETALFDDPLARAKSPLQLLRQLLPHLPVDSPVLARAERELAALALEPASFTPGPLSLPLDQAPKPRRISEVPHRVLIAPVFPRSPRAPHIPTTTRELEEFPMPEFEPVSAPVPQRIDGAASPPDLGRSSRGGTRRSERGSPPNSRRERETPSVHGRLDLLAMGAGVGFGIVMVCLRLVL